MKNAIKLFGIIAFVAVIGFFAFSCDNSTNSTNSDNPGILTITNIGSLTPGNYVIGETGFGQLAFLTSAPQGSSLKGRKVTGTAITLNAYQNVSGIWIQFKGDITIPSGQLGILECTTEEYSKSNEVQFFKSNKSITFSNGSASINLSTDMDLQP